MFILSRTVSVVKHIHVCVVLGSRKVSDEALKRACYVLRFLLADRQDLRHAFYSAHGRVAVIATGEQITLLPEYAFLGKEYDEATRGLGAVPMIPVASAGEENILCEEEDIYLSEDILIRELSISILRLAVSKALPGASNQLHNYYTHAKMSGWWRDTYAILTPDAYFVSTVFAVWLYSCVSLFRCICLYVLVFTPYSFVEHS